MNPDDSRTIHVYKYNESNGNTQFLKGAAVLGHLTLGSKAVTVNNDHEMVAKVAIDPYGIGYCSSTMVDLNSVQVLGIVSSANNAQVSTFPPQTNPNCRWIVPANARDIGGCFVRPLWAIADAQRLHPGPEMARHSGENLKANGGILHAIQDGPLFQASYRAH